MNILFWERSLDPSFGGVERVTLLIAKFLEQNGCRCYYMYYGEDYKQIDDFKKLHYSKTAAAEEIKNLLEDFVRERQIDCIVNQGLFSTQYALVLKALKEDLPVTIITCHHLSPDFQKYYHRNISFIRRIKYKLKELLGFIGLKQYSNKTYIQNIYDVSDKFVLLSQSFINDFVNRYRLNDRGKIACIPDPCSFQEVLPVSNLKLKQKEVLIISRLEDVQKNITGALRIWKEIEKRGHHDWILLLGGYGPDENYILEYANKLKLERFNFLGKIENVQKLYENASIFMMTSRYEGFGMTLTEALQLGCIPIAFDSYSSLHDIIDDNINGFIVPNNDYREYVDKIENLLEDSEMRLRMGNNAIMSSNKFSIETIGHQWLSLLGL